MNSNPKRDPLAALLAGDFGSLKGELAEIDEPSDAELAALEGEIDDDDDEDFVAGLGEAGEQGGSEAGGGMEALLQAIMGSATAKKEPAEPNDQVLDETGSAIALVELLVGAGHLELEPGHQPAVLGEGVAVILARGAAPSILASALSAWLLRQDAVAELYCDDDALESILAQW